MNNKGNNHSEEDFIVSERPEIGGGGNISWVNKLANAFPALQNKNYKNYFFGQFVSLIGTWLQIVAQGWLVLQLTNSAFYIGLVTALSTAPSLLFSLFGGVIVDRYPKKKILLYSQNCAMVLGIFLGLLTIFDYISLWGIGLISFLLGTVNAVDSPARQAFVPEMVTLDELPSAIALNSSIFNAARVIGPSIAGLLIALVGTGGAFIINGLSHLAVIAALLHIKVEAKVNPQRTKPLLAIKEGIVYSFTHPIIRILVIITGVVSIFGWSYTTIMPLIAKEQFNLDAAGLGYLFAASGLGSLVAAFIIGAYAKKLPPVLFIFGGHTLFALSLILFTYTSSVQLALPLLFFVGMGLLSQSAMINTIIQSMVKSELRGRVMSIYILMFIGLAPLGSFQIGWISENMGMGFAIRLGAIIVFLFGLLVFIYRKKIRNAYFKYKATADY